MRGYSYGLKRDFIVKGETNSYWVDINNNKIHKSNSIIYAPTYSLGRVYCVRVARDNLLDPFYIQHEFSQHDYCKFASILSISDAALIELFQSLFGKSEFPEYNSQMTVLKKVKILRKLFDIDLSQALTIVFCEEK